MIAPLSFLFLLASPLVLAGIATIRRGRAATFAPLEPIGRMPKVVRCWRRRVGVKTWRRDGGDGDYPIPDREDGRGYDVGRLEKH